MKLITYGMCGFPWTASEWKWKPEWFGLECAAFIKQVIGVSLPVTVSAAARPDLI